MLRTSTNHETAKSIQSGNVIETLDNDNKQSLSSNCSKICIIFIFMFVITAIAFMINECFFNKFNRTYYSITVKNLRNETNISYYSYSGQLFAFSLSETVKYFWKCGAHYNSILTALCSIIWPFIYIIILLHIWLIPFSINNISHRKYRTIFLFIFAQIGKYQFIATYGDSFLAIGTAVILNNEYMDLWVKSIATDDGCLFMLWSTSFMQFAFILLWIDQFTSYKKYEFNPPRFDNKKWYILSFEESKNKSSLFGVVMYSIYLVILIFSVYMILFSLNIAQIGFTFGGIINMAREPVTYNAQWMAQNLHKYVYENTFLAKNITEDFQIYTIIIPLIEQSLIIFIWFIPLKNQIICYLLRFCIWLQTINCIGVYWFCCIMVGINSEMKDYTSWLVNNEELTLVCNDKSIIYNTFNDGCYYADTFYVSKGMILLTSSFMIQWGTLIYTLRVTNKFGINAIKFG